LPSQLRLWTWPQTEFRARLSLLALHLFRVNDAAVDLRHSLHALSYTAQQIAIALRAGVLANGAIQDFQITRGAWKPVGLLASAELQAMLQPAEELVTRVQLVKIAAADVIFVVQLLQREKRTAGAQPGFAPAVYPLQALHQELDV